MTGNRKIGIIGIGPRGGFALENLIYDLVKKNSLTKINLVLFEVTGKFGNGQVYDLNQVSSNWINITERVLKLEKRETIKTPSLQIPSFPSYHEWINKDFKTLPAEVEDTYPPRAHIGEYLSQRFQSLIHPLIELEIVSLRIEKVIEINLKDTKIQIKSDLQNYEDFDEILLTIGHQPTKHSSQILDWDKFSSNKQHITLFKHPYPIINFLECNNIDVSSTIGVRGFGLAMIDIIRGIAEKFGNFIVLDEKTKRCKYQTDHNLKGFFVPFSLDGLPPVPKPLNAFIDKQFEPSEAQIQTFKETLGNRSTQEKATGPHFLVNAFSTIAANVYCHLPETINPNNLSQKVIEQLIVQWLENNNFEHPLITSNKQPTSKIMGDFVEMAIGKKASSLDFCIGQVWRHCQPSIYEQLSFNRCSDSVFADIIALDESTKRYSYGPPVESIQQMLALVEVGALNLDMVDDPDFELTNKGWKLHTSEKTITANVMINSVLDAPKIKSVDSPLVRSMLSNNLIQAVHDDLGVHTDENGYLMLANKDNTLPIALLGRLAKGTIIGVDAILECFGSRPKKWGKEAARNHIKWLHKLK